MRWLVWLLLLGNVLLLGYFQSGLRQHVEAAPSQAISPEKLKIITPEALAQMPKKGPAPAPADAPPVTACYEWGSFAAADAQRAKAALQQLSLEATAREQMPQDAIRYWVYIPPRRTLEEAQIKVNELKALGVEESYIVQEPKWLFAISLGVFKEEALATRFLQDLQSRGVRSAIKGRRNHEGGQTSYTVHNITPAQVESLAKLQPDFPGSEFKQTACQ